MGYHFGGSHNSGHGMLLFCGVFHPQEFLSSFNLVPVMLGKWKKSPHVQVSECKAWSLRGSFGTFERPRSRNIGWRTFILILANIQTCGTVKILWRSDIYMCVALPGPFECNSKCQNDFRSIPMSVKTPTPSRKRKPNPCISRYYTIFPTAESLLVFSSES